MVRCVNKPWYEPAMKIILAFVALTVGSLSVFAGDAPRGRLVADCKPTAETGAAIGPTVQIYNTGSKYGPSFEIVASFAGLAPATYASVDYYTIPGEEVHFDAPGFRMEVVTNLDNWADGDLPGRADTGHPENAYGIVWTTIGGRAFADAGLDCTFNK